ncbi:hypothetical protein L2E82_11221 [Cichorium intybus]|uniref:Uncharacterized protein n=1 Tax=Cichorium intybus TaxID=13427 RepID=A0ACB9GEP5_CICIN|nr:hypothetical protein L2E82_11221 [Cichorium intybus]
MSDHVASDAGGLTAMEEVEKLGFLTKDGASSYDGNHQDWQMHKSLSSNSEAQDGDKKECRICHEDDFVENLEAPCANNGDFDADGSSKLHSEMVQREKKHHLSLLFFLAALPGWLYTLTIGSPNNTRRQFISNLVMKLICSDSDGWDEEVFIRSRLFPAVEPQRIFGINPYDGLTPGDHVKAVIILAILLIVRQSYLLINLDYHLTFADSAT